MTWVRYGDNLMFHPNCRCEIIEGFGLVGALLPVGKVKWDRFGGRGRASRTEDGSDAVSKGRKRAEVGGWGCHLLNGKYWVEGLGWKSCL